MFDLERFRTKQFDQFQPRRVYSLPAGLVTVEGTSIPEGLEFRFDHAFVNIKTNDSEFHGTDSGGKLLVFRTKGDEYKRIEWDGREFWPEPAKKTPPAAEPAPPEGQEKAWLARQPGFEAASAILAGQYSTGDWGAARRDADVLRAAAKALADSHPSVARFLADKSLHMYHVWMSQATSGGEGTAMQYEVREELKEMRKLAE